MSPAVGSLVSTEPFEGCDDAEMEDMAESMEDVRGMLTGRDRASLFEVAESESEAVLTGVCRADKDKRSGESLVLRAALFKSCEG